MKHISIIASVALLGLVGFSGCSGGGGIGNIATSISKGVGIDGYLNGAIVTLNGVTTKTSSNGTWSITTSGSSVPINSVIKITGGIDTATGQQFEGQISAIANTNGEKTFVTPISSLVVPLVKSNSLDINAANNKIATQLGLTVLAITSDPIADLNSSDATTKANAQKVIKQSLVVQKVAESFAKSIVKSGTSKQFSDVTDAVFAHIADQLNKDNNISTVINDINSTTSIANIAGLIKSTALVNVKAKLTAAGKSVHFIAKTIDNIKYSDINTTSFDQTSKAIEIITSVTEKQLINIADANNSTSITKAGNDVNTSYFGDLNTSTITDFISKIDENTSASAVASKIINDKNTTNISDIVNVISTVQKGTKTVKLPAGTTVDANALAKTAPAGIAISIANGKILVAPTDSSVTVSKVELVDANGTIVSATSIGSIAIIKLANNLFLKITMTQKVASIPNVAITTNGNLTATGSISNTALQVNKIQDTNASLNVFYVKSNRLSGDYANIQTQLGSLLNIKLTAQDDSNTTLNADYMVTVVVRDNNTSKYVAASTKAHFEKLSNGKLNVTTVANNNLILQTNIKAIPAITITNAGTNFVTSTTNTTGKAVININVASMIDKFANNSQVGTSITNFLVNHVTIPSNYDAYLLVNKIGGSSFISDTNSVTIDASSYDNDLGITYGFEKAIQVHTIIN